MEFRNKTLHFQSCIELCHILEVRLMHSFATATFTFLDCLLN